MLTCRVPTLPSTDALREQIKGVARVLDFDAAAEAGNEDGALRLNYTSTPRSGYKSTASPTYPQSARYAAWSTSNRLQPA